MPQFHARFKVNGPLSRLFSTTRPRFDRRLVRLVRLATGFAATVPLAIGVLAISATPASAASAPSYVAFHGAIATNNQAAEVVAFAHAQLGKPYRYGSAGPSSYDCSGLAKAAWARAGVTLAHYTGAQWDEGVHISRANLRPGDLVFFGSDVHHVGIYIGNGQMIEAPHSGLDVRIAPAFRSDYVGAVRP
jgi:cell wall-associated NlpC family hydrolase